MYKNIIMIKNGLTYTCFTIRQYQRIYVWLYKHKVVIATYTELTAMKPVGTVVMTTNVWIQTERAYMDVPMVIKATYVKFVSTWYCYSCLCPHIDIWYIVLLYFCCICLFNLKGCQIVRYGDQYIWMRKKRC